MPLTFAQASDRSRDLDFLLSVFGIFGIWLGGGNFVARRFARRRWGDIGARNAFWLRKGRIFAPDWFTIPIFFLGAASLVAGAIAWAFTQ